MKIALILTTFALALGLVACDSGEAPTDGGTAPAVQDPAAATPDAEGALIVYCGRTRSFVEPVLKKFTEATGHEVQLKDGKTAALAATLLEEGENSPCDVFWAQDAGALGALSAKGMFRALGDDVLTRVPQGSRSTQGDWVGITGRARVACYNTAKLSPQDLPSGILEFTDPKWKGRIGWAPKNASFQAWVTALRVQAGDDAAKAWLQGIVANEPREYPKNTPIVKAAAAGEVDVGFVNHYYLFRVKKDLGGDAAVANHYFADGDIGNLVNVAGAGVIKTSKRPAAAQELIAFLLSPEIQQHFTDANQEYPLVEGVKTHADLQPLSAVGQPDVDLNDLKDLEATLGMLRDLGILK